MLLSEYQLNAARTLIDKPEKQLSNYEVMLLWNAIGLSGESGEVADLVKKAVFHRHELNVDALIKELGDVLWYVAAICSVAGIDMADVANSNIEKLKERYPHGFSSEASKNRMDGE